MKVLKRWFGTDDDPSRKVQAPRDARDVPADYASSGKVEDYDEDTSFNWRALESTSSNIFDSPDTHRVRILQSESVRPANDDDNPGYDPYDTGRFDAKS